MNPNAFFIESDFLNLFGNKPKLEKVVQRAVKKFASESAIEGVKKSERPLLHLLARTGALEIWKNRLEWALEHSWSSDRLLDPDRQNFSSFQGELYVGEHFESLGLEVKHIRQGDLRIQDGQLTAEIEVYTPAPLLWLHQFRETIKTFLSGLDVPYDFTAKVSVKPFERRFNNSSTLHQYSHEAREIQLQTDSKSNQIISSLSHKVSEALQTSVPARIEMTDAGIEIAIELQSAVLRVIGNPIRRITILENDSALGIQVSERLQNFIQTSLRNKLSKKQAKSGLIVYIGEMDDRDSIEIDPGFLFAKPLREEYTSHKMPCEFVAFLTCIGGEQKFRFTHFVYSAGSQFATQDWFGEARRIEIPIVNA